MRVTKVICSSLYRRLKVEPGENETSRQQIDKENQLIVVKPVENQLIVVEPVENETSRQQVEKMENKKPLQSEKRSISDLLRVWAGRFDKENSSYPYLFMTFYGGGVAKTIKTGHRLPYYDPESINAVVVNPSFQKVIATAIKRGLLDPQHPVLLHLLEFDDKEPHERFKKEAFLVRTLRKKIIAIIESGSRPIRPVHSCWFEHFLERGDIPDL